MMALTFTPRLLILAFILTKVEAEPEENLCDQLDCQNGGVCRTRGGVAECRCPRGYKGTECDEKVSTDFTDPCKRYICFNDAVCRLVKSKPTCVCTKEFTGKRCDKIKETKPREHLCDQLKCQNGGICGVRGDEAECVCPRGYIGTECEYKVYINPCKRYVCFNDAVCHIVKDKPTCVCTKGFTGKRCNKKDRAVAEDTPTPPVKTDSKNNPSNSSQYD